MKDNSEKPTRDPSLPLADLGAGWRNPQKSRLRSELAHLEATLKEREHDGDIRHRPALRRADAHLQYAKRHWRRDSNAAWQHAFLALEQIVRTYPDERLVVWARTLRAELCESGRFTYWRQVAIENLLKGFPTAPTKCLNDRQRETYFEALRLRDQSLINQYWRLSMVRHHQLILAAIGAPVLTATAVILARSALLLTRESWKMGATPCLLAVLFGILGAIVSAAQRFTTTPPHRIPEILGSDIASVSRIPIGAVAGLTLWLFSIASVRTAADLDVPNLFLAAFGAGFAERLIVQGSGVPVSGIGPGETASPLPPRPTTSDDETPDDERLKRSQAE
jgi:hypothetical protein